jgi:uncharacterized protein YecT (DUF1311 family)
LIWRAVILLALLCAPAAAQTQIELTGKAAQELNAAEAQMKAIYDGLAARYGVDSNKGLREAQEAWLVYRDKQCAFENKTTEKGSLHRMMIFGCMKALTELRIAELKRQENCPDWNLACVRN